MYHSAVMFYIRDDKALIFTPSTALLLQSIFRIFRENKSQNAKERIKTKFMPSHISWRAEPSRTNKF